MCYKRNSDCLRLRLSFRPRLYPRRYPSAYPRHLHRHRGRNYRPTQVPALQSRWRPQKKHRRDPKRAGRRNWRRFLVGWLQRCQDKGGTHREAGNRPSGPTPEERAKRRFFRGDAQRSMTDQEYAEWRRGKRPSTEAAALAGAITLAKEGT